MDCSHRKHTEASTLPPGDHGCRGSAVVPAAAGEVPGHVTPRPGFAGPPVHSICPVLSVLQNDLPEASLAKPCLPVGNLPWFLCRLQEKGPDSAAGIRNPSWGLPLSSLAPHSLASPAPLPKCRDSSSSRTVVQAVPSAEMPFPFFPPGRSCSSSSGDHCETGSSDQVEPCPQCQCPHPALSGWSPRNPYSIPK